MIKNKGEIQADILIGQDRKRILFMAWDVYLSSISTYLVGGVGIFSVFIYFSKFFIPINSIIKCIDLLDSIH